MIDSKKEEKASISLRKIISICLIFLFISGICVLATDTEVRNLKIVLASGYEIETMTTKTKVSEILNEKHIVLLPDEKVTPSIDEEIGNNTKITISKISDEEAVIEIASSSKEVTLDQILKAYEPITEKIEVIQEAIPFETITKDVSDGAGETNNKVLQEGKEGLKETTYKVKYQNQKEISRVEISSQIVEEPVNKIIQVKAKVTNRSAETRNAVAAPASGSSIAAKVAGKTPVIKNMNTSAYTASTCDKSPNSPGYGKTASGAKATAWYTIAAGKAYPMGTIIYIPYFKNKPNGGWFVVQDRGGAISNNKIDVYMGTYNECIQFGRRNLECYIYQ